MTEEKFGINENFSDKSYSLVDRNLIIQADGLYVDCRLYKWHNTWMTCNILLHHKRSHNIYKSIQWKNG